MTSPNIINDKPCMDVLYNRRMDHCLDMVILGLVTNILEEAIFTDSGVHLSDIEKKILVL